MSGYESVFPLPMTSRAMDWPAGWTAEQPEVTVASRRVDELREEVEDAWRASDTEAAIRAGLRLLRAERALAQVGAQYPDLQYVGPLAKYSGTSMAGSALNKYWRKIQTQVVNAYYADATAAA